jgi:hypothetical protein
MIKVFLMFIQEFSQYESVQTNALTFSPRQNKITTIAIHTVNRQNKSPQRQRSSANHFNENVRFVPPSLRPTDHQRAAKIPNPINIIGYMHNLVVKDLLF